ncbi:MAG TPA: hypothetical protein VNI02_19165 [Blastocatellia bacterium]|nr:hypothetical protein [Blastocatellia bacterium]
MGVLERERRSAVASIVGVPRWLYGQAARGLLRKMKEPILKDKNPARSFSGELAVWDLAGFFYGKHFYKPAR